MNTLLNPTRYPVIAKFDGANYRFLPGERVNIFNSFAAKHIENRWGKYGIVDITFSADVAKKYVNPTLYEQSQKVLGITRLLQTLIEKAENFKSYEEECGDKKTVARLRVGNEGKKVPDQIKEVEADLKQASSVSGKDLIDQQRKGLLAQAEALRLEAEKLSGNNTTGSGRTSKD